MSVGFAMKPAEEFFAEKYDRWASLSSFFSLFLSVALFLIVITLFTHYLSFNDTHITNLKAVVLR